MITTCSGFPDDELVASIERYSACFWLSLSYFSFIDLRSRSISFAILNYVWADYAYG